MYRNDFFFLEDLYQLCALEEAASVECTYFEGFISILHRLLSHVCFSVGLLISFLVSVAKGPTYSAICEGFPFFPDILNDSCFVRDVISGYFIAVFWSLRIEQEVREFKF